MINFNDCLKCEKRACTEKNKNMIGVPSIEIDADKVKILMISEAPPLDLGDYFYSKGNPFYMKTTIQAFNDAGINVSSISDVIDFGVYITTAIKCSKTQYSVSTDTVKECSYLLEKEIGFFNNIKAILLMGDVAIKAMNYIWKRQTGKKVIPSGSTYKIRSDRFYIDDIRVFPSYLQTGGNYLIEKSKRIMIAEDIKQAFEYARD